MYPYCDLECMQTPGLCTYYAIMTLVVVVLAVSLIWLPFMQLIYEINTIIAKVVVYINNQFLGITNSCILDNIESLLVSQKYLLTLSICCITYGLYLASGDFLFFAACFISSMPNSKYIKFIKELALEVIVILLNLKGKRCRFMKKHRAYDDD